MGAGHPLSVPPSPEPGRLGHGPALSGRAGESPPPPPPGGPHRPAPGLSASSLVFSRPSGRAAPDARERKDPDEQQRCPALRAGPHPATRRRLPIGQTGKLRPRPLRGPPRQPGTCPPLAGPEAPPPRRAPRLCGRGAGVGASSVGEPGARAALKRECGPELGRAAHPRGGRGLSAPPQTPREQEPGHVHVQSPTYLLSTDGAKVSPPSQFLRAF